MDKEFKNKLSQNLHLYFGYFYDQNGKKIKPDEIVTWFEKQQLQNKSDEDVLKELEWLYKIFSQANEYGASNVILGRIKEYEKKLPAPPKDKEPDIENKVSDISAEEILKKHLPLALHPYMDNALKAMEEYAALVNERKDSAGIAGKIFQIDFGVHLEAKISVTDRTIKVIGAINGWGDVVPLDEIKIIESQPKQKSKFKVGDKVQGSWKSETGETYYQEGVIVEFPAGLFVQTQPDGGITSLSLFFHIQKQKED